MVFVLGRYFLHFVSASVAQKVHPEVLPELLVSDTVDDWTEKTGQDVDDQVVCKSDFEDPTWEDDVQDHLHARRDVGEHAHSQLGPVEEDGVPGFLGWCLICGEGSGCKQDPQVGDDQNQKHTGEVDDINGLPFVRQDRVFEHILAQAEHRLMKEAQRLGCKCYKQICNIRSHTDKPNHPDDDVGPPHGADLGIPQRFAYSYVALDGHGS